jgi:hypothetical protein
MAKFGSIFHRAFLALNFSRLKSGSYFLTRRQEKVNYQMGQLATGMKKFRIRPRLTECLSGARAELTLKQFSRTLQSMHGHFWITHF